MTTLTQSRLEERVIARISVDHAAALDRIALDERRRRSDVMRIALEEFVERRQAMAKTQETT